MDNVSHRKNRASYAAALFCGDRLKLARQLAGLRKSELAGMIEKSATAVAAWESGSKRPTADTVARLSLSLGLDPSFFSVRQDNVTSLGSVPHFRSLRSTSQLARDQAFAYGRVALDVAHCLERYVEFPEADVPSVPVSTDNIDTTGPEDAARLVREVWEVEQGPIRHMVRLIENHGILTVFSPLNTSAIDAYSFDSGARPIVILNPIKHDYYRQRFDTAHELGHLVMHTDPDPGSRIAEQQANRFASELLLPANEIRNLLPTTMGGDFWNTLASLKEQWGVSLQAILFRSRYLGQLGEVPYRNAMAKISSRGWRREEPGLMEILEQPSLLPRAIEMLTQAAIDKPTLISQCQVPMKLFEIITSRVPELMAPSVPTFDPNSPKYNDGS